MRLHHLAVSPLCLSLLAQAHHVRPSGHPQLFARQAKPPCTDPDSSGDHNQVRTTFNVAGAGSVILDTLSLLDGRPNFPNELVAGHRLFAFDFDCSNLDDGSKCVAPTGPEGNI
jgi:hypothetical protein